MTRKSKRELERTVEDLEPERGVAWREVLEYLEHVAVNGSDALGPEEYFEAAADWRHWRDVAPAVGAGDLPPGVDPDDLSAIEAFGYRYCGTPVRRGILERHLERGGERLEGISSR